MEFSSLELGNPHGYVNMVIEAAIEAGAYRVTELDGETIFVITGVRDFGDGQTGHAGITRDRVYIAARKSDNDYDRLYARNLIYQKKQWQKEALDCGENPDTQWHQLSLEHREALKEFMTARFLFMPPSGIEVTERIRAEANALYPRGQREADETSHLDITVRAGDEAPVIGPATDDRIKDLPSRIVNQADGSELALVPGGWFWMGSGDDDREARNNEKPRHLHFLKPYYMSITCVTVKQFKIFVRATGYCGGKHTGTSKDIDNERWGIWKNWPDDLPAVGVNWFDAAAYCSWAGVHLPREAQWELAARGYDGRKYPWGNDWEEGRRLWWNCQKELQPWPFPAKAYPNEAGSFGMLQMLGNVSEWCNDWYDGDAYAHYARGGFFMRHSGNKRIVRGGSYNTNKANYMRPAYRFAGSPENRYSNVGFRVAQFIV